MFGGILSDFKLGKNTTLEWGLFIVTAGYIFLTFTNFIYISTGIIIIGTGMIRPNKISLIGSLYKRSPILKDEGFSLFYLGVNLGAYISVLIVPYICYEYSYKAASLIIAFVSLASVFIYRKKKSGMLYLDNHKVAFTSEPLRFERKTPLKWLIVLFLITALTSLFYWGGFEISASNVINFQNKVTESDFFGFKIDGPSIIFLNGILLLIFGIPIANYWTKRGVQNRNTNPFYKFGVSSIFMSLSFVALYFFTSGINLGKQSFGYSGFVLIFVFYLLAVFGEMCLSPVKLSFVDTLAGKKFKATTMGFLLAFTGLLQFIPEYFYLHNEDKQINPEIWVISIIYYLILAVVLLWLSSEYYEKLKNIIK